MKQGEINAMKEEMLKFAKDLDDEDRQEFYQTDRDNVMETFNRLLVFIGDNIIENDPTITRLDEDAKELLHKRNELVIKIMNKMKLEV